MTLKTKTIFKKIITLIIIFFCSFLLGIGSAVVYDKYIKNDSYDYSTDNFHYKNNKTTFDNYKIQDAFTKTAIDLAKDQNNILIYHIGWVAVLHRYAPIVHISKILEINPNQEIYLYINTNSGIKPNNSNIDVLQKYNNLTIKFFDNSPQNSWANYKFDFLEDFYKNHKKDNIASKHHLFIDDYTFLKPATYNNINNSIVQNVMNSYIKVLKDFSTINLIADGIASISFWENNFYQLFQNPTLEINPVYDFRINIASTLNRIKRMPDEQIYEYLSNGKNTKLLVLMLASFNYEQNPFIKNSQFYYPDLVQTNFFVPSTSMIIDANNSTSTILSLNDKYNEFFDPYYSLNMHFIEICNSLKDDSMKQVLDFFKIQNNPKDYAASLEQKDNVIYTGSLVGGNMNSLHAEALKIIDIYNEQKSILPNMNRFKLWFKGHPRENTTNFKEQLIKAINSKGNYNAEQWFDLLDFKIPFEMYLASGIMENDSAKNKTVKIYTTFSTYVLFVESSNKYELIEKIMITKNESTTLFSYFGSFGSSLCFPYEKIKIFN